MQNWFTTSTRCNGDGSDPCYVVYFERQIVATFPINDPASSAAREYAESFCDTMNAIEFRKRRALEAFC